MVFRVFCRYFGFAADWENWGENDRMSEGVGGGEGKITFFKNRISPSMRSITIKSILDSKLIMLRIALTTLRTTRVRNCHEANNVA